MRQVAIFMALLAILAACSSGSDSATESSQTSTVPQSTTSTTSLVGAENVEPWEPFSEGTVAFATDGPLPVLVADTPEQRSQGLMEVTDLKGYAGMLFVFETVGTGGFWMKNTVLPLTVLYLDENGVEVSRAVMEPCVDGNDCPGYPPEGPYFYALEMPTGSELLPTAPAQVEIVLP
jgi:uncharacterized protein